MRNKKEYFGKDLKSIFNKNYLALLSKLYFKLEALPKHKTKLIFNPETSALTLMLKDKEIMQTASLFKAVGVFKEGQSAQESFDKLHILPNFYKHFNHLLVLEDTSNVLLHINNEMPIQYTNSRMPKEVNFDFTYLLGEIGSYNLYYVEENTRKYFDKAATNFFLRDYNKQEREKFYEKYMGCMVVEITKCDVQLTDDNKRKGVYDADFEVTIHNSYGEHVSRFLPKGIHNTILNDMYKMFYGSKEFQKQFNELKKEYQEYFEKMGYVY